MAKRSQVSMSSASSYDLSPINSCSADRRVRSRTLPTYMSSSASDTAAGPSRLNIYGSRRDATDSDDKARNFGFAMLRKIYALREQASRAGSAVESASESAEFVEHFDEAICQIPNRISHKSPPTANAGLRSLDTAYKVSIVRSKFYSNYHSNPIDALVHRFDGIEAQTVVAYDQTKMQLLDPFADRKVEVLGLSPSPRDRTIKWLKPVSLTAFASVSCGNEFCAHSRSTDKLQFVKVGCSAQNNQVIMRTYKSQKPDEDSGGKINMIESANPEHPGNDTRVSMFTGGLADEHSGGRVYQRVFDINNRTVEALPDQIMKSEHFGDVTALCHVSAGNYIVSGSSSRDIICHDDNYGRSIQKISLESNSFVGNITSCPSNPNLFMVGHKHPVNALHIYDRRDTRRNKPKLVIHNPDSQIWRPFIRSAWEPKTGANLTPMYHSSTETGLRPVVNVWDPRYIKGKAPTELRIPDNTKPVNSVNFARSAPGSDPVTFIARRGKVAFTDLAFDMQAN